MCIRDFFHDIILLIRASIVLFLSLSLACFFVVCLFDFCLFVDFLWVLFWVFFFGGGCFICLFVCCFVLFCLGFFVWSVGLLVCFLLFSHYLISTSKQVVIALPHHQ